MKSDDLISSPHLTLKKEMRGGGTNDMKWDEKKNRGWLLLSADFYLSYRLSTSPLFLS